MFGLYSFVAYENSQIALNSDQITHMISDSLAQIDKHKCQSKYNS